MILLLPIWQHVGKVGNKSSIHKKGCTMETVRWSYSEVKKHSHNVIDSKLERARKVARAAGIDSNMCFLMAHNAMVALHYGKP